MSVTNRSPDPETMRTSKQLEAALVVAATPSGTIEQAFTIAEDMVARRLVSSTRNQVVVMMLVELTRQHLECSPGTPDPYAALCRRLVREGRIQQFDVEAAVYGRVLASAMTQGWIDAEMYDQVMRFARSSPEVHALLSRLERRETRRSMP